MRKRTITINKKSRAKRIKELRGGDTLAGFGKKIGVAHSTVKRYEQGMEPSGEILVKMAHLSGKSVYWILTGREEPQNQPPLPPPSLPEDEYLTVPLIEGRIAAGEPIIAQEDVIDWVVLHIRPVKKAAAGRDMAACRVSGDSMHPHLSDGDIVVIDRTTDTKRLSEKKIYAVWKDGGITAKLVQTEGRHMFLKPLNPAHNVQVIDLRENPSPIVGQVIGAWKDFRTL